MCKNKKNKTDWSDIPFTKAIFDKMAKVVGLKNIDEVDVSKSDWTSAYRWTEKQRKKFENWVVKYLYDNMEAQKEVFYKTTKSKRVLRKLVYFWIEVYGWKYKDKEKK